MKNRNLPKNHSIWLVFNARIPMDQCIWADTKKEAKEKGIGEFIKPSKPIKFVRDY